MKTLNKTIVAALSIALASACATIKKQDEEATIETIRLHGESKDIQLSIHFQKGTSHNHPSFALWVENVQGENVTPIFVTKSVATGIFRYGETDTLRWSKDSGSAYRPAALPYFFGKMQKSGQIKNIPTASEPLPDAYTGATPQSSFNLIYDMGKHQKFKVLMEINQPWDWNKYWNNSKFPNDVNYKHSCQPSVVYAVEIDLNNLQSEYYLNPIGHGHYSGEDGALYTNLKTLTTALEIVDFVKVEVVK